MILQAGTHDVSLVKNIVVELEPYNLTARCVDGRVLVSWQVGGKVVMVNPLEMDTSGEEGKKESSLKVWGTRDQMEVCLDEYVLLRRGQVIWLELYKK